MSGYWKVGIYPFYPTAFKPYEFSNTSGSAMKLSETMPKVTKPHGSESSVRVVESDPGPSVTSVPSEDQMNLFQTRYENGYDIYEDPMYVEWLRQQHPDALPEDISLACTAADDLSQVSSCTSESERQISDPKDISTTTASANSSVTAASETVQQSANKSHSLSASLANARNFHRIAGAVR